jgi:hypothetical protein
MPLVQTRGAASAQGFGEFAQVTAVNYIEDVFSTYLYDGTGANQTITNGIDLLGKGGLVWGKCRDTATYVDHNLFDTTRGFTKKLMSNQTNGESDLTSDGPVALSNGFSIKANTQDLNNSAKKQVSWTFRKQPKFFDIVTFTGDGTTGRTIAHNLGSAPGCILVKRTDSTSNWTVYHRESEVRAVSLNLTDGAYGTPCWGSVAPTSTTFTVSLESAADVNRQININSATYVAYLFAHDAGGFGLTGTDNVISCGSYKGNGSATGPVVTLGYEPQWLMIKKYLPESPGTLGNWQILDIMRGIPVGSADATLQANLTNAESSVEYASPTATGFQITSTNDQVNSSTETYIYIAIRRGLMKVPTDATKVFIPTSTATAGGGGAVATTGFPVDLSIYALRDHGGFPAVNSTVFDRLRGSTVTVSRSLVSSNTDAEVAYTTNGIGLQSNTTVTENWTGSSGYTNVLWNFRRASGYFDEVCYTGTGGARTVTHNLAAVPELMIVKGRSGTTAWQVYSSALANTEYLVLNTTAAKATGATRWNSTTPTSSVFSLGTASDVNTSAATYVAYLFAICAGVSKVGAYTGTATTLQIDCGFTGGARFVLIKRTDSTGDWYVWDSARGIVAGNDPYLLLNSTAAEVTSTDYVDTYSAGFEISSTAPAAINASGGTFIFLAIA